LNNQKQQALSEIGGITYQMFRNPDYDGGTAIQDKCSFVAGLEEEIRLKEEELEKIRQATDESINKTEGTSRYWDVKPEEAQVGPIIDITPTSADNKEKNPSPVPEAVIAEVIAEHSPQPPVDAASQPEKPAPEANPEPAADASSQPKRITPETNPEPAVDASSQPKKITPEANPEPAADASSQPKRTTPEANPEPAADASSQPDQPTPEANPSGTADSDGTTPSPAGPWKVLCETCLSIIDENSKFCSHCGTRLK
jgi:hypothetical protein